MPVYRCHIEKYHPDFGEYWTNVYHIFADNLTAAVPIMDAIVAAERPLYAATTMITKGRCDDGVPNTDAYRTKVYNQLGTRDVSVAGQPLPLFVTARVDFSVADGGRPCRKYLRGVVREGDSGGVNIVNAANLITQLTAYANAIIATAVVDPQGFQLDSGAPMTPLQMRQLRRGRKKKVTP